MRVSEVCGSCKGEVAVRGFKAFALVREWRLYHRCEGPQITYLFQSTQVPEWFDEAE